MQPDEHVYCTNCKHFRLCDENIPYCPFEDVCDINNPDDSVPYKDRSYFEKNENKLHEED
jgi:hypothetical protein